MKVQLFHGDISQVSAEGLVCPVDGAIAVLGGPAAAIALKRSFAVDERDELFGYLEEDVRRLRPICDGEAKIVPGEGKWDWLVVVAALPHHVNDTIIGEDYFANILERSIISGIRASVQKGVKSIAMTVIGSSYRLPVASCILSSVNGIKKCQQDNIDIIWCFLERGQLVQAEKLLVQAGVYFSCTTVDD